MKALIAIGLILAALAGISWVGPDVMPVVGLVLAGLALLVLCLRMAIQKDAADGWRMARVWTILGMCLGALWTLFGLAAGPALAVPAFALLALSVWGTTHATRKMSEAIPGRSAAPTGRMRNVIQAAELRSSGMAEARRSEARGKMIEAQRDAILQSRKVDELEKANEALRRQVAKLENELDAAINDPFYDPLPKV